MKETQIVLFVLSFCFCAPTLGAAKEARHLFIISGQSNMAKLDLAQSFSPIVEKQFGAENVVVVQDAKGGQSIQRWYKKHPNTKKYKPGDLYDQMMGKVKQGLQSTKPKDLASITFLWMQGEQDTRRRTQQFIDVYEEALNGLMDQLKADLGRDDINFVIGRLS